MSRYTIVAYLMSYLEKRLKIVIIHAFKGLKQPSK